MLLVYKRIAVGCTDGLSAEYLRGPPLPHVHESACCTIGSTGEICIHSRVSITLGPMPEVGRGDQGSVDGEIKQTVESLRFVIACETGASCFQPRGLDVLP